MTCYSTDPVSPATTETDMLLFLSSLASEGANNSLDPLANPENQNGEVIFPPAETASTSRRTAARCACCDPVHLLPCVVLPLHRIYQTKRKYHIPHSIFDTPLLLFLFLLLPLFSSRSSLLKAAHVFHPCALKKSMPSSSLHYTTYHQVSYDSETYRVRRRFKS